MFTKNVARVTRREPLVEQERLTLPKHLSSPTYSIGFVLLNLWGGCNILSTIACFFSFVHPPQGLRNRNSGWENVGKFTLTLKMWSFFKFRLMTYVKFQWRTMWYHDIRSYLQKLIKVNAKMCTERNHISCICIWSYVCFISWSTPRNWTWGPVKNENLRQKRSFQLSHCELSIYMQQYSSSTCIWSIYLSVDTIFQRLWLLSWVPWWRIAANKEASEPRVPVG